MTDLAHARVRQLVPADLGGPGVPVAELCSAVAIAVLGEAAGPGFRMTSLALDIASHPLTDAPVDLVTRVDKRARAIVFVSAEARAGPRLVFSAQGLFSAG